MTEEQRDILKQAVVLLAEQDRLRRHVRENDTALRLLCREYDKHFGVWGSSPHHLRINVENCGLKIA